MRKPEFAYAKTKTQISFTVTAELNIFFLNPVSSHDYTGLSVSDMFENLKDVFPCNAAHIYRYAKFILLILLHAVLLQI